MADELTPLNEALEPQIQLVPGSNEYAKPWVDAAIVSIAISLKRLADVMESVTLHPEHEGRSLNIFDVMNI